MPIGCGQAFCASQQQSLDIHSAATSFAVYLGYSSLHPIVTAVYVSSHLISRGVFSASCTSSHVFSPFLNSSLLITIVINCSHVIWACLISSQFIWIIFSDLLSFSILRSLSQLSSSPLFSCQIVSTHPTSSQLISPLLRVSQLFSAPWNSPHVFSSLLSSSHIFSALLTFSQMISALLSSCQLSSPHLSSLSDHLSSSLAQNMLQNRIPVPKPQKVGFCMKPLLHANLKGKYKASKKSIMKNSSAQL